MKLSQEMVDSWDNSENLFPSGIACSTVLFHFFIEDTFSSSDITDNILKIYANLFRKCHFLSLNSHFLPLSHLNHSCSCKKCLVGCRLVKHRCITYVLARWICSLHDLAYPVASQGKFNPQIYTAVLMLNCGCYCWIWPLQQHFH